MLLLWELAVVLALCLVREVYLRAKYDLHKIPSPKGLPFIGQTIDLMYGKDLSYTRGQWHESLGRPKIFKARLLGQYLVYINDPVCYKSTILSSPNPFPKSPAGGSTLYRFVGTTKNGTPLVSRTDNCEYAKVLRSAYLRAFSTPNMKKYIPKLEYTVDKMIEIVDGQKDTMIDFQKLCVKLTLDSIGFVAFEHDFGGLDDSGPMYQLIIDAGHLAIEYFSNPLLRMYCTLFPKSEKAVSRERVFGDLISQWEKLANACLLRDGPSDGSQPLWYAIRTLINPETGELLARDVYRAELGTVVIAGMDTTGHQLSWILGLLATHPRVADKLYEEIKYLEGKKIELEELADLVYLSAVVKEGMRVCTAVHGIIARVVPEDMTLMGYRLQKDTRIIVPSNRSMDSDADWGDAKVFRPERWIEEEIPPSRHYLPFSYGPRDCVGQRLALLEIRVAIIKLLLRYKFSSRRTYSELLENGRNGIAIEAADGMWLHAESRQV